MNMRAVGVCDFAGSYAKGVVQSGFDYVAKREPSAFGGFGVTAIESNFEGVQIEVSEPEFWSVVNADMIFGCPPCSGFSNLSVLNTRRVDDGEGGNTLVRQRGIDSPDNVWMGELVHYAAKVKPPVVVFESVGSAGKLGAPLMRELWQTLRDESGLDYHMTDVFMNAALVGGDVIRSRYFFVAHLRPFGVDLPREVPRSLMEVIGDLGPAPFNRNDAGIDMQWGHVTNGSATDWRTRKTIELFRSEGHDWAQGSRLKIHLEEWIAAGHEMPDWWIAKDGHTLTYAITDSMYVPFRWYADKPMGVVAGGFLDRAVHPTEPRGFTYREGARFMGLPDDWSLYPIVAGKNDSWLGKAIPVASGRWISTWARGSLEGAPGEYAGSLVEPKHRVINVSTPQRVKAVERMGDEEPIWWPAPERPVFYQPGAIGFLDQGFRVMEGEGVVRDGPYDRGKTAAAPAPRTRAKVARTSTPRVPSEPREPRAPQARTPIKRVRPETFRALMEELGLTRSATAEALGVSHSRVAELIGQLKPASWLNVERWPEVERLMREAAAVTA